MTHFEEKEREKIKHAAGKSIGLPVLKQILTLTPLLIFVPMVMGIDGILVAGPVSDFIVIAASFICTAVEFKRLDKQIAERNAQPEGFVGIIV